MVAITLPARRSFLQERTIKFGIVQAFISIWLLVLVIYYSKGHSFMSPIQASVYQFLISTNIITFTFFLIFAALQVYSIRRQVAYICSSVISEVTLLCVVIFLQTVAAIAFSASVQSFACSANNCRESVFFAIVAWLAPLLFVIHTVEFVARARRLSTPETKVWNTATWLVNWEEIAVVVDSKDVEKGLSGPKPLVLPIKKASNTTEPKAPKSKEMSAQRAIVKAHFLSKAEDDESDSGSDVDDEDREGDEGADAKSIFLDDGNCSNGSSKSEDEKPDLGSVSGSHSEGESSGEKSGHNDSEENGKCVQSTVELTMRSEAEGGDFESDVSVETEVGMVDQPVSEKSDEVKADVDNTASAALDEVKADVDNTVSAASNQNNPEVPQVEESADVNKPSHSEPLDLANYSSAAELETLGLEKLKMELQTRGLKCGGTLKERAARLFLLKTTPLDKLPKKLLAKPAAGGK